ncbi:MAG TPA: FAD-dependent oxidoreductase [Anaeromyxobacteraceae bacterium]|nr:FAD-dependent oxidoreductase [Anaeromyxobacteraceae bacterium]
MESFTVIGAGLSGLTVASELAALGHRVTVIERSAAVGGLARTFRYADRSFDVGPHRFHTDDARVEAWIAGALGGELLTIERRSAVQAFGRVHDWPLRPRVLASLPLGTLARAALDLLRRPASEGESFEAEMRSRYGATLYEAFFEPYTRRFLEVAPASLHRDWGRAGVDRAVIDRRRRISGLPGLLRSTLFPPPVETVFRYPAAGIGRLAERLAERLTAAGGRLLLGRTIEAIEVEADRVVALRTGHERLDAGVVVWTAPLTTASRLLGVDAGGLRFRSTLLFNLALARPARVDQQWIYFAEEPAFVRVSLPTAFSAAAAPPGAGALGVERTCVEGDADWRGAESLVPDVVAGLVRARVIGDAGDVESVHVERVADSYPVYTLGYREARDACLAALGRHRNLLLAGRCGRYWYNNMDHTIGQALSIADQLAAGRAPPEVDVGRLDFWCGQGEGAAGSDEAGR